jgi:hypothetical protein
MRKLLKIVALFLAASSIAFAEQYSAQLRVKQLLQNYDRVSLEKAIRSGAIKVSQEEKCMLINHLGYLDRVKSRNLCDYIWRPTNDGYMWVPEFNDYFYWRIKQNGEQEAFFGNEVKVHIK